MTQKSIIITGATGSIGQGLCKSFKDKGWRVIGTDYAESCNLNIDSYISIDLDPSITINKLSFNKLFLILDIDSVYLSNLINRLLFAN